MDLPVMTATVTLADAMALAWLEADLLDSASYDAWLALWAPQAMYVVPIEPGATDFENTLNYAYDDDAMRRKRVDRLVSGQSVSASPVARTVRLVSRFRLLSSDDSGGTMRCAQLVTEFRRGRERTYTADLEYRLVRGGTGLLIAQKVVRLINSTASLQGIGYIL